jgi:hypothetical protein
MSNVLELDECVESSRIDFSLCLCRFSSTVQEHAYIMPSCPSIGWFAGTLSNAILLT